MTTKPNAIFLMGPTASGKTDIAIKLVQEFPCEIISVDSAMVYRGLDIGTAKPDEATQKIAPHRLINICDPSESYSAAQFAEDARREMDEIVKIGKIPLLVGGTFLYYRALYEGLSPLPSADADLRQKIEHNAKEVGWAQMHQKLRSIDPEAADRIHPNDPQRIQRALEVFELTGESMSDLLSRKNGREEERDFPYNVSKLILAPDDRAILHERIALRFKQMMENGLVGEVTSLYKRGDLHKDLPAIRAVGYRQVWSYLEGELPYEEMIERGVIATRQLAKRQFTWLRSEKEGIWFNSLEKNIYTKILNHLSISPT